MTRSTYDSDGNLTSKIVDSSLDADGNPRAGTHLDLTWSWTHDDAGRITSETRPNGNVTKYFYDPLGRLKRVRHVRDSVNEDLDLVWDFSGNLLLIEDPLGEQWTWTYDERNLPLTKTDPLDNTWTYHYDEAGRLDRQTDPLGHVTTYAYDEDGRLIETTVDPTDATIPGDELNLTTAYTYDTAGRLATEVVDPDDLALTTAYAYDEAGQLTGITRPNGGVYTFAYDDFGNLISVTDPLLNDATYTYDGANRLTLVTDPLGQETSYGYDMAGRRTSTIVDPGSSPHLNLTTNYGYDAGSRMTSLTTDPGTSPHLNLTSLFTYDDSGNLLSETNPENETTWYEYDVYDRLVEITDPLARVTEIGYDAAGHRTSVERLGGRLTTYDYDERDLLVSITDELENTTSYGYDDAGRRTSVTNPRGFTTNYAYDAADRLTSITDAATPAGTVRFSYDAAGRMLDVTNPLNKTTTYAYDELGNVVSETDPLDRERSATYDLLGQIDTVTDARGVTLDYTYDDAGQLTTIAYPAFGGDPAGAIAYGYDAAGRQISMSDVTGTTGWVYDPADRVTSVSSPQGTIGYTYDGAGRRTSMTQPGSLTVAYGYDDAGQLTDLTDWSSTTPTTYDYNINGQLTEVIRPNGTSTVYDYDAAWRPNLVEHADASSMLARYAYDLDANGNRSAVHITGSAVTNGTEDYTYDALDRLTEVTYPSGGGTIAYEYDANGNRVERTSGFDVTTYAYDDADQLTTISGAESIAYTYDENGNRLSADANTFAYDWRDRLTEATVDSTTVDYTYAGDDLRATRDDGTTTTDYLWDRIGGLPQLVSDGTTEYVWGAEGLSAEINATGDATTPLLDLLGSIRLSTDDTATVVGSSDFEVFGGLRAQFGTQSSLGWTGELRDPDTGLTYLRARDYSPGSGRFIQRDSVNPSGPGTQGYQRYAYANGNPATFTDPSGHAVAGIAIATAFGYTAGLAGTESALGLLGASVFGSLAVVLVVLTIVLLTVGMQAWCYLHGVAWNRCLGTAGRAIIDWLYDRGKVTWSLTLTGATAAAATACEGSLGALDPLGTKNVILSVCPKLPKPNDDCATAAATEFGVDVGTGATDGGGLPDTAIDVAEAGLSAYQAYKECKEGRQSDPCTRFQGDDHANAGVYLLRDPQTGKVMRTGMASNLVKRRSDHDRGQTTRGLVFEVVYRTNDKQARRGLEQMLYDQYPDAQLNKQRPISPRNRNRQTYLDAAQLFLDCRGG